MRVPVELTTVADDIAVFHEIPDADAGTDVGAGVAVHRFDQLQPDTDHELLGIGFRTLAPPPGPVLCRFATVNDVHFGETEAGRIDDHPDGPIRRAAPGEPPYPETMNRAAVSEIAAIDPVAVIVKGDLTLDGADHEFAAFEECYATTFGDRLHVARGNHDAYRHQNRYAGDRWIELPGLNIALLDTTIAGATTGSLSATQLEWLEFHIGGSSEPVIVMGHHQQWIGEPGGRRSDGYFGLHPDASDALDEIAVRCPAMIAYTAGHTHRHRLRRMTRSRIPSIEIGCTKDFPGTWAEYRVYGSGVMQVVHRMSAPDALAWSSRCRSLYSDFGVDYASYALGTLADRCTVLGGPR